MVGAEDASPLGPVLELMRLLWAIDQGLQKTSKRMEATLGITGPQRLVIRLIGRFPRITMGGLAERMLVHPSTVTGIVRRLERGGLVTRRVDPRDRRRSFLGLTARGRRRNKSVTGTLEAAVRRVRKTVPASAVNEARTLLAALAADLQRANRTPARR
jgi:MarR family transcriptional regulator, organic hydroperoxide resistance regulator